MSDASFDSDATLDASDAAVREEGSSPLATAGRLLRGRWHWALGIGAVFAVVGVALGVTLPKPLYKSVGLIDVAPKVARVLYGDVDEKGLLPMFDAYVVSEAALVSTRRVVDNAMASPEWRRFGRGTNDEAVAAFQDALEVTHPKFSEHIEVAFVDPDPDAAATAVNQVIAAYMKIVDERENLGGLSTRTKLENARTVDQNKLAELRADMLAVTEDLGEQAIQSRYDFYVAEVNKLETVVHDLDLDIAASKSGDAKPGRALTERDIAIKDAGMDQLLLQKEQAERRVDYLLQQGLGDKHSDLIAAREAVKGYEKRVAERADAFRSSLAAGGGIALLGLPEKQAHRDRVAALRDDAIEQTKRLGKQILAIKNLTAEQNIRGERLEQVKKRLDQISMESDVHGRITVLAQGDRPVEPDTDRRFPLGILGGVGGMALGFVVVMIKGLREGQLRHLGDVGVGTRTPRLLGVVPDVSLDPQDERDPLTVDTTDYCVHHIRTMLQLRPPTKPKVVALTSAIPGAGKTTLGMALGMSFATTRARTLLVDLDFFGHGLTSVMRSYLCREQNRLLPMPAGTVLNGNGHSNGFEASAGRDDMLSGLLSARRQAADESRRSALLSKLRERAAAGDESAARAIESLAALERRRKGEGVRMPRGVLGVLEGRPLEECVIDTGVENLDLLPVGDALAEDAARLSQASVARLIAQCRAKYDVVLVDTGPVLGSIEAAFVASAVDDVVVVVSRGERRPAVDDALERLDVIGGRVAGVVFNRASNFDIATSSYGSCSQSRSMEPT